MSIGPWATPRGNLLIENSIFDPVEVGGRNTGSPVGPSDPSAGTPLEAKIPKGRDLVVYAGTLERYQGIDLLIAAFAKVLGRHSSAFLLVVGETAEQVARYSALAKEHGVTDYCRFTGRVPQALARRYTSMVSVLVSPRSAGTNTPLKVY